MRTSPGYLSLLFILDPFPKLDLRFDTSLAIMMECERRGHSVFYADAKDIVLASDSVTIKTSQAKLGRNIPKHVRMKWMDAGAFDYIFIRKDPPVDLEYIYMTYKLEFVPKHVRVINSPKGIRDANEKILGLRFKQWMPRSIVTASTESILDFQKKAGTDLVLKPLNRKGGEGILLLPKNSKQKEKIVRKATLAEKESVIAQKFIPKALTQGDKRVLLWDGKILGTFGRVPKKGEFRANISCGGSFVKTVLTSREKQIVTLIKPTLKQMGLIFVGLDLIDGWITEINVTSPAGIVDLQELYGIQTERPIVDWLERNR